MAEVDELPLLLVLEAGPEKAGDVGGFPPVVAGGGEPVLFRGRGGAFLPGASSFFAPSALSSSRFIPSRASCSFCCWASNALRASGFDSRYFLAVSACSGERPAGRSVPTVSAARAGGPKSAGVPRSAAVAIRIARVDAAPNRGTGTFLRSRRRFVIVDLSKAYLSSCRWARSWSTSYPCGESRSNRSIDRARQAGGQATAHAAPGALGNRDGCGRPPH